MLMENPEGDWLALEMKAGETLYVPKRYAHRSINVSPDEQLITYFVFRADAGHDYGTIETKGYRKLMVERDGKPTHHRQSELEVRIGYGTKRRFCSV